MKKKLLSILMFAALLTGAVFFIEPAESHAATATIKLGETKAAVTTKLGKEKRVSANEYKLNWYTYHNSYKDYYMVSYLNDKVTGIYTMDTDYAIFGIRVGSTLTQVKKALGTPIKGILKGSTNYLVTNDSKMQTFYKNGAYITIFFDSYNDGKVTGIQVLSSTMEKRKAARYGVSSTSLRSGFELQLFDLVNADRVKSGLKVLFWSEKARNSSRLHSQDMVTNKFFSHTNLKGKTPFDRMKAAGISYWAAGENIAYGQSSSIFAHESLMNSIGHRNNILNKNYTHLGTGVAFKSGSYTPYYTQNFYKVR
ncbi:CAP-associated domain-containing protein [Bacillus sp. FJAT-18017]|uniref:CAP domain-containing protein n=1 Tax=Bacillus sp. FJAT-18017 TaxID=1705566 RepID=UPI0006B01943|nr:CAP-associated domain-containing protein [Bacillus sp. FJAT-18017]